jgi:predicted dehydrogenase
MEKPFTVTADEAEKLIAFANERGRKITVGHDLQFSHAARRLRKLVGAGYLGGQPLHMESYYCYDLSDPAYAKALLSDRNHWVRRLPGKLLQNTISHGIARIAEYLTVDSPQVSVHGFVSPLLRSLGEEEIVDEVRVTISDGVRTTAYFTFSSQMQPSLNQFRVYGPKAGLIADEDHQTVIRCRGARYPSYAEKFIPPVTLAGQYFENLAGNVRKFLGNDFHMKSGMAALIALFYRSIGENSPPPISYAEILRTAQIMDDIFAQLSRPDLKA